jgi:hypothetical protein
VPNATAERNYEEKLSGNDGRQRRNTRLKDSLNNSVSKALHSRKHAGGEFLKSRRVPVRRKSSATIDGRYNNAIPIGWQDLLQSSFSSRKSALKR